MQKTTTDELFKKKELFNDFDIVINALALAIPKELYQDIAEKWEKIKKAASKAVTEEVKSNFEE